MGAGAAAAMSTSAAGSVIACFRQAAYVHFPGGIVALTSPSVPLGPLHVSSTFDFAQLTAGDPFAVPDHWRHDPEIWRGELPDAHAVAPQLLAAVARRSALLSEPLHRRWEAATRERDLAAVCRLLGGLGPGLTPSGDDALAGILLAARIRRPDAEEHLVALADQVDTHEIARAFLLWAARWTEHRARSPSAGRRLHRRRRLAGVRSHLRRGPGPRALAWTHDPGAA